MSPNGCGTNSAFHRTITERCCIVQKTKTRVVRVAAEFVLCDAVKCRCFKSYIGHPSLVFWQHLQFLRRYRARPLKIKGATLKQYPDTEHHPTDICVRKRYISRPKRISYDDITSVKGRVSQPGLIFWHILKFSVLLISEDSIYLIEPIMRDKHMVQYHKAFELSEA